MTGEGSRVRAVGWLLFGGLVCLALAFRLPHLPDRPMHGDEANQAVRAGMLMDQGVYHYDPSDHHGPTLYYAALPFCRATASRFPETTEWNFRLVPVCFAVLTMLWMWLLAKGHDTEVVQGETDPTGRHVWQCGILFALLFFAVSPAFVYYNRFFIQESLLVCFLTGMFWTARLWCRTRRVAAAVAFGVFAGLCMTTKETFVLSFTAAFLAVVLNLLPRSARPGDGFWRAFGKATAVAALAAAFVFVLFYSSFFTYWQGVKDALFSTVGTYFHRATGVPEHQHPWWFYLQTVFWFKYGRGPLFSEAFLFPFAILAGIYAFRSPRRFALRFLLLYTVILTVLYSLIPYKTPWCALTFLHGWILLAGIGVAVCFHTRTTAAVGIILALALASWHGTQSVRAAFRYSADPRNPYVYAHTGGDCLRLVEEIERCAAKANGFDTPIAFGVQPSDTWPLPWYLRRYRHVGYWTNAQEIPLQFSPSLLVVGADQGEIAAARFGEGKESSFYGVRPGTLVILFTPKENE
ncbi:MAG: TIGR03663 family protein [Kiritimatiellae bacterium]|nr:TIGR03663 family protein [Kiritimatiellia bacterium]